ncbi:MAG TPA: acyl-CoA thioesterase, partial [Bacillota bacterium]|nr:acyl-CoA thioesterase [Bacillota bacterium]
TYRSCNISRGTKMKAHSMSLELRIDWSEIDLFGHVNNVAIFKYIQAARVNYLESIGLMQLQAETKNGPILASTNCQFRKPLFYPGQVKIYSKVDTIKNTSFRIQHEIYNDDNQLSAEAQDIIVFFDFNNETKLIIPNEIRQKIETLENKKFSEANISSEENAKNPTALR